jgi:hypothetical protein
VKANGEIISTIPLFCDQTVLRRQQSSIELKSMWRRALRANSCLPADNARQGDESEMIVAGSLEYSVSHFIDCHLVARTL